jgi:copper chaperone CopZ
MKRITFLLFTAVIFISVSTAQDEKIKETEFKVSGNCGMCKSRIEKALKIKEVKLAKWDKKTKMLKVAFDEEAISIDSLMHRVAEVGHDTDKFKAPDSIYDKLPNCCLYRSGDNTH